jgi:hypothetical protein
MYKLAASVREECFARPEVGERFDREVAIGARSVGSRAFPSRLVARAVRRFPPRQRESVLDTPATWLEIQPFRKDGQ